MSEDHKKPKMDPLSIAESFGIKTFRRANRNLWTPEEDEQLTNFLLKLTGVDNPQDIKVDQIEWDLVATALSKDGSRKTKDFKKRWTTSLDPNLRKGKWTKEEDNMLIDAYEKFGPAWQRVSNFIGTRTTDQCAKRYTEVLDPKTKDRLNPWTKEEELLLIRQIGIHGTKWRTVAAHFNNRPALTCRNKWRNIALNVAKGKAEPVIKQEVEKLNQNLLSNNNHNTNNTSGSGAGGAGGSGSGSTNNLSPPNSTASKSPGNFHSNVLSPGSSNGNSLTPSTGNGNNYKTNMSNSNNGNLNGRNTNHNQTEWKYTLIPTANSPSNIPLAQFSNTGTISDEGVVNQLCQYAKSYNLNIEIHQHIHHHYGPPPHPFAHVQPTNTPNDPLNLNSSASPYASSYATTGGGAGGLSSTNQQRSYFLEPEAQLNRFQHFNYLPPLTELPKLTSSNSPTSTPPQSINTIHTTSTHHNGNDDNHNSNNNDKEKADKNSRIFRREDSPASLTPLTQAVELAAAEEMTKKRKMYDSNSLNKKAHKDRGHLDSITKSNNGMSNMSGNNNEANEDEEDEEIEEGLDFWEQMRNLTDLPQNQLHQQIPLQNQKPVSQHHPLHYFSGNVTPQPQSAPTPTGNSGPGASVGGVGAGSGSGITNNGSNSISSIIGKFKGDDDDDLKAYGMLYRSYSKSRSNSQFDTGIPMHIQSQSQSRPQPQPQPQPQQSSSSSFGPQTHPQALVDTNVQPSDQRPKSDNYNNTQSLLKDNNPHRDYDDNDNDNSNYVYENLLGSFGMMPFNPS